MPLPREQNLFSLSALSDDDDEDDDLVFSRTIVGKIKHLRCIHLL